MQISLIKYSNEVPLIPGARVTIESSKGVPNNDSCVRS